jgi:hypothetical protein
MTTTRETCLCECQECLSLRAAADDPGSGETIAAFEHDGSTYQIDHLGIGSGSQWGEFVVYRDDEEAAEFTLAESVLRPRSRQAGLPVSADELVWLARQALSRRTGRDDPSRGLPPGPLPARLGPQLTPGFGRRAVTTARSAAKNAPQSGPRPGPRPGRRQQLAATLAHPVRKVPGPLVC